MTGRCLCFVSVSAHACACNHELQMITSWNEWHEDTQIEPTVSVGQTDKPINMTCYGSSCGKALTYNAYGELYLDILREGTGIEGEVFDRMGSN